MWKGARFTSGRFPSASLNRRHLLLAAAGLAAVAVLLAASGGVRATVGGLRISARSPWPAGLAALLVTTAWWAGARRSNAAGSDLDLAWLTLERHSRLAILVIAAISAAVSAVFATSSAAGADASGYLSEAAQWAAGQLFHRDPLAGVVAGGDPWVTVPLGWRPGPLTGLQSPTYPPGLPLLMALPHAIGGAPAAALVVAASAAVAVWATGLMATSLAGGVAGILAAITVATTPVFLYQAVQPMSDVPVTAAWMLCWALLIRPGVGSRELGVVTVAGLACALAVLIRPNLAPLAVVPLFAIGWHVRKLVTFSMPVALAGLALAWLQWQWYGSPWRSGYGAADELFAVGNAGANASRYLTWMAATSPLLLIAPAGAWLAWRRAGTRPLAAFAVLVVGAYLVYAVFEVWSYLRFLLPVLAVGAVFAAVAVAAAIGRIGGSWRLPVLAAVVLAVSAHGISQARALEAFRLADQQRRVEQVAAYVSAALPPEAVIVAGEQSGAIRYYTGHPILRWDAAPAEAVTAAVTTLHGEGRPIVMALDAWEREPFRAKYAALPAMSLEWPPAFEAGTSHRTLVWRLADREVFLRGGSVQTVRQP